MTAGSTSELFARAFCREIKITVPPERWVCTLDYQDALEEMKLRQGVTVCSTWEPYSSWMLERDDAIQVMCTTRELDPLVVDFWWRQRTRTGQPLMTGSRVSCLRGTIVWRVGATSSRRGSLPCANASSASIPRTTTHARGRALFVVHRDEAYGCGRGVQRGLRSGLFCLGKRRSSIAGPHPLAGIDSPCQPVARGRPGRLNMSTQKHSMGSPAPARRHPVAA